MKKTEQKSDSCNPFPLRKYKLAPKSAAQHAQDEKIKEEIRTKIETKKPKQIGDKAADGSIYLGISPVTKKPLFAMPEDAQDEKGGHLTDYYNEALQSQNKLNNENYLGHNDWRMPTPEEIELLYKNKDQGSLKGTFNENSRDPTSWYWSWGPAKVYLAMYTSFSYGLQQLEGIPAVRCSARFVRS